MDSLLSKLNNKLLGAKVRYRSKENNTLRAEEGRLLRFRGVLANIASPEDWKKLHSRTLTYTKRNYQEFGFVFDLSIPNTSIIKEVDKAIRKNKILQLKRPNQDQNKKELRFHYCRYADDWILIGNFSKMLAEKEKTYLDGS